MALVETFRVGGECPYVACMPSKAMLRSAQARDEARSLADLGGASVTPSLDDDDLAFRAAVQRRDGIAEGRDDHAALGPTDQVGVHGPAPRGELPAALQAHRSRHSGDPSPRRGAVRRGRLPNR